MDLLKDVYEDFFADPSEKRRREQAAANSAGKTSGKPAGTPAAKPAKSGSDALKNAQDALDEAKALFENAPAAPTAAAVMPQTEVKKEEPETDPEEELEALIGLKDIKHDVRELADFAKVQKLRQEQGLKSVPVSLHLVFTGNPGTGKTTVARILGRMYNKIGILSSGQLIEVDRSGLVAGYVGQTAIKVQKVIQSAMGGVLFIDEAYALSQENDPFGQEAIDTLLKAMEDHRDNLIVIIAGYTGPMEGFINSNPGLKSRFNKYIEFPDYTADELEAIFYLNCNKYEYIVDEDAKNQIRTMILLRKIKNPVNFANGREVRNMFEEIITNQARRVAAMENPSPEDLRRITTEDLWDSGEDSSSEEKTDEAAEKSPEASEKTDADPQSQDIRPAAKEEESAASDSGKTGDDADVKGPDENDPSGQDKANGKIPEESDCPDEKEVNHEEQDSADTDASADKKMSDGSDRE